MKHLVPAMAAAVAWIACAMPRGAAADAPELTLTMALDLGVRRAPTIRSAQSLVGAADAGVDDQRAAYFPTLTATGTGSAASVHSVAAGDSLTASIAGTLHWTVFDFGRTPNAVAAAKATFASAKATSEDTERRVRIDVASAYLTAYYKNRLHEVAIATLSQREQLLGIAKGLVKAGLQPPLEEIRASSRTESARLHVIEADAEARDAYAVLAGQLGLPTPPSPLAAPRLPSVRPNEAIAEETVESLPSVVTAVASAKAREEQANAALSHFLPSTALEVLPTYSITKIQGDPRWEESRSVTGQVVVTIPIFDLALPAQYEGAKKQAASAKALADQARRDARNEAARAALALRGAKDSVASAARTADSAAAVLAIVQARYVQGLSSPLELIDAESADAEARVQRTQAELTHGLAVVRMLAAAGNPIVEATP